ncbi:carboxypeptidase-like regulatory domain-containing protein [Ferruginibacter sp. SUN002]|uniref:carboxypeptidase-like regulatory domain-containing protein n=1 Tax=Ferruginibacter sp. SUN002 TaxID=2937789 RepID=UPI003D35A320
MAHFLKTYFILLCILSFAGNSLAQLTVSGTVYDSTKIVPVKGVVIKSNSGTTAVTDSSGRYSIVTSDTDSLHFFYNDKPTVKFAVKQIDDISSFDISLRIRVKDKYKHLKEVTVFSKSYKQDSVENRLQYAKIFDYSKPGISTTSSSYSGVPGLDLDEFVNIFRFKRNRQLRSMQNRLIEQEQENYINYRFNKSTVKRVTRLEGAALEDFMKQYRPDYEFTKNSTTVEFYQYILNASYQYKKDQLMKE